MKHLVPFELSSGNRLTPCVTSFSTACKRAIRRQEAYPDWLLSGTLICGCCGEPIKVIQCVDAKGYVQLGCSRGIRGSDCTLRVSKSKQRVEKVVLDYLRSVLLTDEMAAKLVEDCNAALAAEAAKPRIDTGPMRQRRDELLAQQRQLAASLIDPAAMNTSTNSKEATRPKVVLELIAKLQSDSDALDQQIRDAEKTNRAPTVRPICTDDVRRAFESLGDLLEGDVRTAAVALRAVTGPIHVAALPHPRDQRRQSWKLSFTPRPERAICVGDLSDEDQPACREVADLLARQHPAQFTGHLTPGAVELLVDTSKPNRRAAERKPTSLAEACVDQVAHLRHDQN